MTALPITGGCFCGAVRYEIAAEPLFSRTCWCRFCQYAAAGSATVNAIFPSEAVRISGPVQTFERTADSGNRLINGFCPTCGTQITSRSDARPQFIVLRMGTLDDPGLVSPQLTIWTAEAPAWACIDPSIPSVERQPPPLS